MLASRGDLLRVEENVRLTQTGRATPMGELLRRHWHPIAAVTELECSPTKAVRLLGEDLVLYRDLSGTFGLLALHCPHRRADLSYGFVEECGLRCSYHGWAFDEKGTCLAQPFEDTVSGTTRFRDQIKQPAYPVQEMAGLLFAYLGPAPAPVLPRWELFDYKNGFAQIVLAPVDCNWLQAAENNVDPVHFEWLHNNWTLALAGRTGPRAPTHLRIAIDEYEYGFGYRRILETSTESDRGWARPRLHLMPNIFVPVGTHFEYRVPVDDTHMLSVVWAWQPVPNEQRPYVQERIPHWNPMITDPVTGRWISTHVVNQDTIAWTGQGAVTDRENEHLARSDIGVVKLRRRLEEDMKKVELGEDPSGVFRDPAAGEIVSWPDDRRQELEAACPVEEWLGRNAGISNLLRSDDDYFRLYAGQPPEVRKAYEEAMGI